MDWFRMLSGHILEIYLFVLILVVMLADLFLSQEGKRSLGGIAIVGLGVALAASFFIPTGADAYGLYFQRLFLMTSIFVLIQGEAFRERIGERLGEFHTLLLFATTGLLFISGAKDFLTLFVSVELLTVSLFILAAFLEGDGRSAEAGMKYVILGALASAFFLYGISFVYGFTGSLQFDEVATAVARTGGDGTGVTLGLALIVAGLCFKVGAVPFHFWVPDVYEGAPTPITAFLTVASKGAGFAALMRVLTVMAPLAGIWTTALAVLAAATLLYGNLGAIPQTNIKRLLGYSSIGQAGFILIGVVAGSPEGVRAVLFYLLAYAFGAMGAFLAIVAFSRVTKSDELSDYHGLWRRSPLLAVAIAISFLSLAGFPPLGGFFGKFLLLVALLESPEHLWLGILAVASVIVSLYYYLGVIRRVLVFPPTDETPIPIPGFLKAAIVVAVVGTIILGIIQGPFVTQADRAAWSLF
ncbi:MAG: NADH-quinone oxidoreductase subunit N [Planctomycetota bacterium]|nr:NADH-quinone oxidoreductase subunit N [Planctomycetota bacterium]